MLAPASITATARLLEGRLFSERFLGDLLSGRLLGQLLGSLLRLLGGRLSNDSEVGDNHPQGVAPLARDPILPAVVLEPRLELDQLPTREFSGSVGEVAVGGQGQAVVLDDQLVATSPAAPGVDHDV